MTITTPESCTHHVYLVHGTQQRFISKLEFIVKLKLDITDHQHALINPNLINEIMDYEYLILVIDLYFLEIRQLTFQKMTKQ